MEQLCQNYQIEEFASRIGHFGGYIETEWKRLGDLKNRVAEHVDEVMNVIRDRYFNCGCTIENKQNPDQALSD